MNNGIDCRFYEDQRGSRPVIQTSLTSRHNGMKVLIPPAGIERALDWLALELANKFKKGNYPEGKEPVAVAIMEGAGYFYYSLTIRMGDRNASFINANIYARHQEGHLVVSPGLRDESLVDGRDVLLVDILVTTGETMANAQKYLENKGEKNVTTVALLCRQDARTERRLTLNYAGILVPHQYKLHGYGLREPNGVSRALSCIAAEETKE